MTTKGKDRLIGVFALIFGLYFIITGFNFPVSDLDEDLGPGVFPVLAGGICSLSGVGLLCKCSIGEEKRFLSKYQLARLALMFLVYVALWIGLELIGYFPVVPIAVFIICSLMSKGRTSSLWARVLYSGVVSGAVWFFFQNVLDIRLPSGSLF